ncbi:DUF4239 domain-containing protein [Accumulibacter sp.]|uniref:bestrophin-like domain n=1 Tax=Accumulibacter sp. TaxID=2053492 RepID=UPI0025EF5648|nr:DUF4239 domain-containing protein [Accumulibacter sp.]MCM8594314.1 DUF4239 domain-containing protein [Accumulibacter sp.]MCM8625051.1 DUF4239 domain-containing protein [Accumulibacter sp.]MDS4048458.1 DUF4239 domain-containing protein [Accumulibacter sp.]
MNWFHELSSIGLAVFVLTLTLVLSVAGVWLVTPRVRASLLHRHFDNGSIAGLLSALIGVYAVAAGLTAVAVWQNMDDAAADVGREAAAIAVLYQNLGGYPPLLEKQTKRALAAYTRHVIDHEWPMHLHGELPPNTLRIIEAAQRAILAFEPASEGQKIVHARVLEAYNRLVEAHWRRLQAVTDTALPIELWVVVTLLGLSAISACFLLRVDSFQLHTALTLLVATPVALVIYFIAVSDHPFQGGISVSPEPYRAVYERLILPDPAIQD